MFGLPDETALDDYLKPEEALLVRNMINAVVIYQGAFDRCFNINPAGLDSSVDGFVYYLLEKGSVPTPYRNNQILLEDISPTLLHIKFVEPHLDYQRPGAWFRFKPFAFEWQRRYGGPTNDEVRRRIGRIISRSPGAAFRSYRYEDMAKEIGVSFERVVTQVALLRQAHVIEQGELREYGLARLRLSEPLGALWAVGGFGSVEQLLSHPVTVNLALQIDITNVIEQARTVDVPPQVLQEFTVWLHRVQEELQKPKGQGRFQAVKDMVAFAADFKELALLASKFLSDHADRVEDLVEIVGNAMPG
jgi:hypothetical protein